VPQAATAAAAALLCYRHSGRTAYRSQTKLAATGLWTCDQTVIRRPCLPFNGLHTRNPCNYMDYYSFTDPEGMEGWRLRHVHLYTHRAVSRLMHRNWPANKVCIEYL